MPKVTLLIALFIAFIVFVSVCLREKENKTVIQKLAVSEAALLIAFTNLEVSNDLIERQNLLISKMEEKLAVCNSINEGRTLCI